MGDSVLTGPVSQLVGLFRRLIIQLNRASNRKEKRFGHSHGFYFASLIKSHSLESYRFCLLICLFSSFHSQRYEMSLAKWVQSHFSPHSRRPISALLQLGPRRSVRIPHPLAPTNKNNPTRVIFGARGRSRARTVDGQAGLDSLATFKSTISTRLVLKK